MNTVSAGDLGFHGAAGWISFVIFVAVLLAVALVIAAIRRRRDKK